MESALSSSSSHSTGQDREHRLKLLIADDNPTERLLLKTILENQGHHVTVTSDGLEAVEAFKHEFYEVVLLDALMPGMDGLEAAGVIKACAGDTFVPVIFLTSLQEADSLARCLEFGDDVLSKPYNSVILQAKLQAYSRMIEMHRMVRSQRDEIVANNQRLLHEQEVAKRVFDKVAHAGYLDAPNIKYSLSPIAVFNGDVALAGVSPSGNLLVLLGDFTGHGLNAAIGAMPMAQAFYSMLDKGFGLRDILTEINLKLHEILPVGVFCCALVAEIDFKAQIMQVWNGGLPDGVIYRPESGEMIRLPSSHLPLGILGPSTFDGHTNILEVHPGDRLYMWTDGIIEVEDNSGEMYGQERLFAHFQNRPDPERIFSAINLSVNSFIGEGTLADDISLLEVMVVKPDDFHVAPPEREEASEPGPKDWSMRYEMRPETLKTFDPLPLMRQVLMQVPPLKMLATQIYTVMAELYSNALEHGLLKLTSSLKSSPQGFAQYYQLRQERLQQLEGGFIVISLNYLGDEEGGSLIIDFEDSGDGFDFSHWLKQAESREGPKQQELSGRGIHLLNSLCKRFNYNDRGNKVTAEFCWGDRTE